MRFRESSLTFTHSSTVFLIVGLILLLIGLFVDWVYILKAVGFPVNKLFGERGQTDLAIFRSLCVVVAVFLITSQIVLWTDPRAAVRVIKKIKGFSSAAANLPIFTTLFLGAIVLTKMVLQLSLYLVGYRAYTEDDFARSMKADYWLQHINLGQDWAGWLSIGSPWLPFPDYLFGLALALHRDLYLTPKVLNLILSGIVVIVAYLLGRELFGRTTGLLTATLAAFQPWTVWLGLSGMTSDLPSVIMITLFGTLLLRYLQTSRPGSLVSAAGCLFVANGIRYENWFFSAAFCLLLSCWLFTLWRKGQLVSQSTALMVCVLVIACAFPVIHMASSYYILGDWIPALQRTDSFSDTSGTPVPKVNMVLLALTSFPLEIASALAGVVLFLRSDRRKSAFVYLLVVVTTFLLFASVFKGRLPVHGGGPERILFSYLVLLLPFAGFLLTRLWRAASFGNPIYIVLSGALLLALGTFDLTRAFNYPEKKYDREAFVVGWNLRTAQQIGSISSNGRILIEKGERWIPHPIIALANKPERFARLDDGEVGKVCEGDLEAQGCDNFKSWIDHAIPVACAGGFQACKNEVLDGKFSLMILSSPDNVRTFQEIFTGRSWQAGRYHIFELEASAKDSQPIDFHLSREESPK